MKDVTCLILGNTQNVPRSSTVWGLQTGHLTLEKTRSEGPSAPKGAADHEAETYYETAHLWHAPTLPPHTSALTLASCLSVPPHLELGQ